MSLCIVFNYKKILKKQKNVDFFLEKGSHIAPFHHKMSQKANTAPSHALPPAPQDHEIFLVSGHENLMLEKRIFELYPI